uniref:Uncharacterized protein G65A3.075 n=1 Tax=Neurospora crassa TaxID=5141 RepID=Q96TX8_NEUCS|nr:hypothetical protein [Neurospora crassa]
MDGKDNQRKHSTWRDWHKIHTFPKYWHFFELPIQTKYTNEGNWKHLQVHMLLILIVANEGPYLGSRFSTYRTKSRFQNQETIIHGQQADVYREGHDMVEQNRTELN